MNKNVSVEIISNLVRNIYNDGEFQGVIDKNTPLVGSESMLDSMSLVQLCLALEDKAEEMGFEFDWTSEKAMSKSKGVYRSIEALSEEFLSQFKKGSL